MMQSILIVDDQQANLVALEATLSELDNVEIISATSGPQALSILLKKDVAMVLLDVQMPGMDGFEVASFMRQRPKTRHVPIIFLTAINKEESYLFKGYENGGVDFLFKPFNPFVLLSKVRIFLELDGRQKQLEEALSNLRQVKTSNEVLLKSVGEGIIGVSIDGLISFINPAAEMILCCNGTTLIGQPLYKSVIVSTHKSSGSDWKESKLFHSCSQGKAFHSDVGVFRASTNRMIPVEYTASPTHSPSGSFDGAVIVFKDITERKKIEEKLHYLAQYDSLTELGNRNLFNSALNNSITYSNHSGQTFALLFMDLDRFKQVNDTLGHDAGDALLKEVAIRVAHCIRDTDILCRLGGDEFTVIISGDHAEQASRRVSDKLIYALSQPFEILGQELYVGASIGIVYYPELGKTAGELIKNADMAMYQAKHEGRNRYRVFESDMKSQVEETMALEVELRRAYEIMDFSLHFQPKYDMKTGSIVGAEALIRWRAGERDVSPAIFIPIAEETGLINGIGRWVFETTCIQVRKWSLDYNLPPGFRVSVNMSVQQLQDPDLIELLKQAVVSSRVDPNLLEVEITESLFLERTEVNMENLASIRELGTGIAIDDFGTGYSSMAYLAQLPFTVLKIDKTFVDDVHLPQGSAIISAVVALSNGLGVEVIAEGVETEAQANRLLQLGCVHAQGFFYSRPLAIDQFEALMESGFRLPSSQRLGS
ncbi:EAL domain-containing protein [Ketobacter sp. MCCC 1A13808]|uniref:EAL domain-containing protein n=1 Tax=Ketobacter sp. MCCC 1A13808 TaxID=2602738 RepID=UPI0012EC4137|nr:EAL domain-containing protein [Ketobacter sp. MCCC 1A13808]MVF10787.1 EAL domain-containing protein [Ketobacter sp. MCCC 1A13808]